MGPKVICLLFVALVLTAAIVFGAPWLAVRGPWVKYKVDVDRIPNDTDTFELYTQYPMLMFERQQRTSEMCFTTVEQKIWKSIFHMEPRVECYHDTDHDCVVSYCLSHWRVMTNNRTRFSHDVSVSMGRVYSLLVADACWFAWWAPAFLLLYCGCCAKSAKTPCAVVGCVYFAIAFAARVALSSLAMVEFYRHDTLTDPPHGGYVQNSTTLQAFTTRSYSFGFVSAWIVIGGNAVFIVAIVCSVIYFCVVGFNELGKNVNNAKTSIRRSRVRNSKKANGEVQTVAATRSTTTTTTFVAPSRNNKRPKGDDEPEVDVRLKSEDIEAKV